MSPSLAWVQTSVTPIDVRRLGEMRVLDDSSSDDEWQVLTVFDAGGERREKSQGMRRNTVGTEELRPERSFVSKHSKVNCRAKWISGPSRFGYPALSPISVLS